MGKETTLQHYEFVKKFRCSGAECEDTCCVGWGMQLDPKRQEKYKKEAPELLDAVTSDKADLIMRRDPGTDYCVKFEGGLCGIHANYGDDFLGDACHFFPRITRKFDENVTMSAALSCPEITRLAILGDSTAFECSETTVERLPYSLTDYLPEGIDAKSALAITDAFMRVAGDKDTPPEHCMARIVTVAKSLENINTSDWNNAINFLLKTADSRLSTPEREAADPYRLLHALAGLIGAAPPSKRTRLMEVITTMEKALKASIDWDSLQISSDDPTLSSYPKMLEALPPKTLNTIDRVLKRWIQAQISMASFPFSGFGDTPAESANIMAIRFATVRLALICHASENNGILNEEGIIKIIQSIARFLDHLSDPELSLAVYKDAGWLQATRLQGLLDYTRKLQTPNISEKKHKINNKKSIINNIKILI